MMKHATLVLLVLALFGFAATTYAAPPSETSGKVVSVDFGKVTIEISGEKPAWVKPNTPVKFTDGVGKILQLSADGAGPALITVRTKLSSKLKAGDTVTFQKGKAMQGC